jgi:hypothetical protein
MDTNIKCEICDHQGICWIYKEHISQLEKVGVKVDIKVCKNFDDVK